MSKKPLEQWIVTIKVKGPRPDVRTLYGDVIFLKMQEGQSAIWTIKKKKKPKRLVHYLSPLN